MREIAATQAAAGLPPALFEAMAEVYEQLAAPGSRVRIRRTSASNSPLGAPGDAL